MKGGFTSAWSAYWQADTISLSQNLTHPIILCLLGSCVTFTVSFACIGVFMMLSWKDKQIWVRSTRTSWKLSFSRLPGLFRRERQCRHSWLLLCSFLVCNLSAAVRYCKPSTTTNVYKGGGVVGEKWLCLLTHFPRLWKGLSTGHLWQAGQTVDYRGIITACPSS